MKNWKAFTLLFLGITNVQASFAASKSSSILFYSQKESSAIVRNVDLESGLINFSRCSLPPGSEKLTQPELVSAMSPALIEQVLIKTLSETVDAFLTI